MEQSIRVLTVAVHEWIVSWTSDMCHRLQRIGDTL